MANASGEKDTLQIDVSNSGLHTRLRQTRISWLADTRFSSVFHLRHGLPEVARGAGSQEETSLPFPSLYISFLQFNFQHFPTQS